MLQINALLRYFTQMERVSIKDYTYELPEEKIAQYPIRLRDQSKLLVYREGLINHCQFYSLPDRLPSSSLLIFNDTKVIPARLVFRKPSGALIEILLLNPVDPSPLSSLAMASIGTCAWECTIGNLKKWPEGQSLTLSGGEAMLTARLVDRSKGTVNFTWPANETFASILTKTGMTPLPPYVRRKPENEDADRYQTIYSHHEGAVAAPTAGLHFTNEVFGRLKERNIPLDFITLHVSAGTFLPVKNDNAVLHDMHGEQISVSRANISNLLRGGKTIIPVGTTSMRTLESLYWYGVKLTRDKDAAFDIRQNDPYEMTGILPTATEALQSVAAFMDDHNLDQLRGNTSIYILPGYDFRICRGLITNFHQPGSTLLLLIAAFIGSHWKSIYEEALTNDYRFLSYGDCSLLLPEGDARYSGIRV